MVTKRTLHCVLIEDKKKDAQILMRMLTERTTQKINVNWYDNLRSGLKDLSAGDMDAVLTSLDVADERGLDIVEKIIHVTERVPIVILCEDESDVPLARQAMKMGASGYVLKNKVDSNSLAGAVNRAMHNLFAKEQLFIVQKLADAADYGFYIANAEGFITYANKAITKMMGERTSSNSHGKNLSVYYRGNSKRKLAKVILPEVIKKGQWAGELDFVAIDGTVTRTIQNLLAVLDDRGRFICLGNMVIDITQLQRTEEALRQSEKKFMDVFYISSDAIFMYEDDRYVDCNDVAFKMFGCANKEEVLSVKPAALAPIKQPDGRNSFKVWEEHVAIAYEKGSHSFEWQSERASGETFPTNVTITQIMLARKILYVVIKDETEKKRTEDNLRKLSLAVEQSPASVYITDLDGKIEYVNPRFCEITGYTKEEVIGQNPRMLKSNHTSQEQYKALWDTITAGHKWRGEFYNKKKNGDLFWEFVSISPIKAADGKTTHYLAVKEDMTAYKEYEQRLLHQANFDNLTDLPNRALALDRVYQALSRAKRWNKSVAVMFIDLDRFKDVNDTLGHSKGDELLVQSAQRIQKVMREIDTVARLGGDEFLIVLPDLDNLEKATGVAERILKEFSEPFIIDDHEIFVTASIGITGYPGDGDDPHVLLRNADAAMYQAKEDSRDTFRFFTKEMNAQAELRINMESHLRHALGKNELSVCYQPVLNMKGETVAAEALVRWKNPDLGAVFPDQFIPLAEDTGLIVPIGAWIMETACKQTKKWQDKFKMPLRIMINVSSRQFRDHDIVKTIRDSVKNSGIKYSDLDIEITEGLILEYSAKIAEMFNEINKMGVSLSIDDFGKGYSALSYLKHYPFSTLKIDRSFINDVLTNNEDAALCTAIIGMAHGLGLEVVGEGVETQDQLEYLRLKDCDFVQGYYFSKPLNVDDFTKYLKDQKSRKK